MARTYIRGNTQILAGSITNNEIDATAGIELSKLVDGNDIVIAGTAASQAIDAGGFKIVNAAVGTLAGDLVTKAQLDSVSAGLDPKESCRAGSLVDIPSLTTLLTVDGVVLVDGNRVLVKDQSTGSENGIYIAHVGAWTRATDFDSTDNASGGAYTFLEAGTQAGQGFVTVADGLIDVGTDAVNWTQFSGGAAYTAGTAIDITANSISVKYDNSTIGVTGDELYIPNGGITETQLNASVAGTGLTGGGGSALAIDDTVVVTIAKYLAKQDPAETPNDAITAFTFNGGNPVVAGSEMIFLNGMLQEPGATEDYTFVASTGVATFTFTPATGDKIVATFLDV